MVRMRRSSALLLPFRPPIISLSHPHDPAMPSEDFPRFSAQELQALLAPTYEALTAWAHEGELQETPAQSRASASSWELSISDSGCSCQEISTEIEEALRRSVNPWTGRFWEKLYSRPNPVGVVGDMVVACSYASGHVESANPFFAQVEAFCVKQLGQLFCWDPDQCDGVTMPGGSASNTLALQTCLTSRFPSFRRNGLAGIYTDLLHAQDTPTHALPKVLIFTSEHCHYSIDQSAVACGLGTDLVVKQAPRY
ncbi:hypothetical protein [Sporisorium scitamineum]|uniref:Glutamate decarboxylase n=1 Tax=Sporisorium scitamineum TaxID=49012 RepID=A0A0F7S8J3_9BASI|nr:hypothetical protein [Sporisorium scitamineum]